MVPRLLQKYKEEIVPELSKKFSYKNVLQAPRIVKVVVNMGVGAASQDIKILEQAMQDLTVITGQKPAMTRSRKAIANFKIRKGLPIGCKVTLRGARMYEFLDRLVNVALPRIRDFRGISDRAFDEKGSYSLGLKEQAIFPEINIDKMTRTQGMDVIINIRSNSKEESFELLKLLGMPFTKKGAE
ncbi:MAG: 50S ribosomal protein L5 [Candidatus Omnitrophica bacterium]|nr:50S ribosomal protein L5 [Candidatus Omnitrophota bacterium]MBU4589393.1 50S ribosomal protein L5 [Candidatus Omnitrophota bacterium]